MLSICVKELTGNLIQVSLWLLANSVVMFFRIFITVPICRFSNFVAPTKSVRVRFTNHIFSTGTSCWVIICSLKCTSLLLPDENCQIGKSPNRLLRYDNRMKVQKCTLLHFFLGPAIRKRKHFDTVRWTFKF